MQLHIALPCRIRSSTVHCSLGTEDDHHDGHMSFSVPGPKATDALTNLFVVVVSTVCTNQHSLTEGQTMRWSEKSSKRHSNNVFLNIKAGSCKSPWTCQWRLLLRQLANYSALRLRCILCTVSGSVFSHAPGSHFSGN